MPDPERTPRGPNNAGQIKRVEANRQRLTNVLADAEAAALVAGRGYDADRIAGAIALADAFLEEYGDRDDATGTRTAAEKGLAATDRAARRLEGALRTTLRALYDGQPEHLERLGVADPEAPRDRAGFLGETRATLAAVAEKPYADAAAGAGFEKDDREALTGALDALQKASTGHTSADGSHGDATDDRDAAYDAFMAWMKTARRLFKLAFRDHPDVGGRVGF